MASPWTIYVRAVSRVRFAPSPTGTLHVGNALSAVANRDASATTCCCGSTTPTRRGTSRAARRRSSTISRWLGVAWDEGPVRQSERAERHLRGAADGRPRPAVRWTCSSWRERRHADVPSGERRRRPRLRDHARHPRLRPPAERGAARGRCTARSAHEPPQYLYHGLVLGADGKKLVEARRGRDRRVAARRGLPGRGGARVPRRARAAAARRAPRPRARSARCRSLRSTLPDEELAARAGIPVEAAPLLRGAHDLVEARALAASVLDPPDDRLLAAAQSATTLERFVELRSPLARARSTRTRRRAILRELKAVGGDLRAPAGRR